MGYTTLAELINHGVYARATSLDGFIKAHPGASQKHHNLVGRIENKRPGDDRSNAHQLSINCNYAIQGLGRSVHHYAYPIGGDTIEFFDGVGNLIGTWNGAKQKVVKVKTNKPTHTSKEDAKSMFTAQTAATKGGARAQVVFNNKVIWESSTVYTDDEDAKKWDDETDEWVGKGKTADHKAKSAAEDAIDQVVESLFTKVKE